MLNEIHIDHIKD